MAFVIFYGHTEYFTAIGNILRPIGIMYGHLVYFTTFGKLYKETSGNPAQQRLIRIRRSFSAG
jgi:hypothetical protein